MSNRAPRCLTQPCLACSTAAPSAAPQDPHPEAATDAEALSLMLAPLLRRTLGGATAAALLDWLQRLIAAQHALLVRGDHSSGGGSGAAAGGAAAPPTFTGAAAAAEVEVQAAATAAEAEGGEQGEQEQHQPHEQLTGMSYLSGSDTWFELPRLAGVDATQPDRVMAHQWTHAHYARVAPLLQAMEATFSE
jgi:hypothetical protein